MNFHKNHENTFNEFPSVSHDVLDYTEDLLNKIQPFSYTLLIYAAKYLSIHKASVCVIYIYDIHIYSGFFLFSRFLFSYF